ncbi:hypothetical protein S7711_01548 [Stachybotrys chartarum IBT 7711]|uniref:Fumarate reductase n=1 Tax=Stachybotrys chartarum (strain CBS 109288 / IBT 7711) TaxID=1280523 RepID=A0A084BC06_STACB|nr:hypothetical protein S7711_01548 [Stachybotrys chartarum IBT 7711]
MAFRTSHLLVVVSLVGIGAVPAMLRRRLLNLAPNLAPFSIFRASSSNKSLHSMASSTKPVIVVGSGLAGLAAAHEALKAGATVHMLERAPKPGGNSIKASSGINGAGTVSQHKQGIEDNAALFYKDTAKSAGARLEQNDVDRQGIIQVLAEQSASAVEWLINDVRVELDVVALLGGHSVARTHRGSGNMPPGAAIVTTLLKTLQQHSRFKLSTSTEATALDTEDGVVRGLHYQAEDGPCTLQGPVVFAAGGFAGDAHGMLAKYRPDLTGIPSSNENRPGPHGILSAIGAELIDMDSVQIHPTGFVDPKEPDSLYKFLAAEMLRGEGGILLRRGKRFINELDTREVVSKAIMDDQCSTGDVRQWDVTLLLDPGACEAAASHLGFYQFKGLVEKKKIKDLDPETIRSIDTYASSVESGQDELGRKSFGHWKLKPGDENRDAEVCLGKVTPITHFTMGGVAFNTKAQVLGRDKRGQLVPIPGLWAAGEITGGVHGDNRLGGSSLLECAVFGREAGRQAAESARMM